jgi:hypothetical protein
MDNGGSAASDTSSPDSGYVPSRGPVVIAADHHMLTTHRCLVLLCWGGGAA